jgi:hypothetical protein
MMWLYTRKAENYKFFLILMGHSTSNTYHAFAFPRAIRAWSSAFVPCEY